MRPAALALLLAPALLTGCLGNDAKLSGVYATVPFEGDWNATAVKETLDEEGYDAQPRQGNRVTTDPDARPRFEAFPTEGGGWRLRGWWDLDGTRDPGKEDVAAEEARARAAFEPVLHPVIEALEASTGSRAGEPEWGRSRVIP